MEQMMNPNLETRQPLAPNTADEPKLWVGCLSCYNTGRLVGGWKTADECKGPWYETMHDLMAENLNGLSLCAGATWVVGPMIDGCGPKSSGPFGPFRAGGA
jgi:hypothetical protein